MSTALLNLDTLVVRPVIAIDKKNYEILSPDELPVLTSHLLANKGQRLEELTNQRDLDESEQAELEDVLNLISDTIMSPIPECVRAKLTGAQRMSVIEAFSTLLLTKKSGTAAAMLRSLLPAIPTMDEADPPQTGAKRSRGSNASTGARRAGGSRKRRSPS
jgi:hypothetical protein